MATNKTMQAAKARVKAAAAGPVATATKPATGIRADLKRMRSQIARALPKMVEPERFYRVLESAISANPKLEQCTPNSFLGAIMQAAQLGLEPNTPLGHAYLIPYRNHGVMECQFQIGYSGLINLVSRTGEVQRVTARTVYENDVFDYDEGWDMKLIHKPALSNRGKPIGFYALYRTKDGGGDFLYMSMEEMQNHAKRFSKTFNRKTGEFSGPWATDFEAMAKKTCVKQLLKYAPINVELSRQIRADETVKSLPTDVTADILDVPNEIEADFEIEELESPDRHVLESPDRHVSEDPKLQKEVAALAEELGDDPFPGQQSFNG